MVAERNPVRAIDTTAGTRWSWRRWRSSARTTGTRSACTRASATRASCVAARMSRAAARSGSSSSLQAPRGIEHANVRRDRGRRRNRNREKAVARAHDEALAGIADALRTRPEEAPRGGRVGAPDTPWSWSANSARAVPGRSTTSKGAGARPPKRDGLKVVTARCELSGPRAAARALGPGEVRARRRRRGARDRAPGGRPQLIASLTKSAAERG